MGSKSSFTLRKLQFFSHFCLVFASLLTFFNSLLALIQAYGLNSLTYKTFTYPDAEFKELPCQRTTLPVLPIVFLD